MKLFLGCLLIMSAFSTTSASAQSAEETVAYILHGIEDGSTSPSLVGEVNNRMIWRKTSDRPLVLHGEERFASMELRIEAMSDCVFRDSLSFVVGQGDVATRAGTIVTVDLRNATDIQIHKLDPSMTVAAVMDAKQQCVDNPAYPSRSLCSKMGPGNSMFFGSYVRAQKALVYLHENYCKPGNF